MVLHEAFQSSLVFVRNFIDSPLILVQDLNSQLNHQQIKLEEGAVCLCIIHIDRRIIKRIKQCKLLVLNQVVLHIGFIFRTYDFNYLSSP
jgi:hypothetical protein